MKGALGLFAVLAITACGGSTRDRDALVGVWQVNGTTTFAFGGNVVADPWLNSGEVSITEGSGDNEILFPFHDCNIPATVSGNSARLRTGFVCVVDDQTNLRSWTLTFTSGSITRSGSALFNRASGSCDFRDDVTGDRFSGQFAVDENLTKVARLP